MSITKPRAVITDWTFNDLDLEKQILESNQIELLGKQSKTESDLIALVSEADAVITQFAKIKLGVRPLSRERSCTPAGARSLLPSRGGGTPRFSSSKIWPGLLRPRIEADAEAPVWELTDKSSARVLAEVQHWRPDLCFLQGFANPALQVELLDRFRCAVRSQLPRHLHQRHQTIRVSR